jgi:hypothetical protein
MPPEKLWSSKNCEVRKFGARTASGNTAAPHSALHAHAPLRATFPYAGTLLGSVLWCSGCGLHVLRPVRLYLSA